MICDRCGQPIAGGYWVMPAAGGGIQRVCRVCLAPPRYREPHEPTEADTRRLFAIVRRMLNASDN